LHFAPTTSARDNLVAEGTSPNRIVITGNTAIDSLHWMLEQPAASLPVNLRPGARMILVTLHRRESFGAPLKQMCQALREIALGGTEELHLVCPVHPNPQVGPVMRAALGDLPNVSLTPPLDYAVLAQLLSRCYAVVTDSGGLQEEAPALDKPVLVLRNTTERPEGVSAGTSILVGTDPQKIVEATMRLLFDAEHYRRMAMAPNPYGDGHAADRIVHALHASSAANAQTV
jgi:UDP-N-acetylglucosamine 2-epimerase